MDGLQFSFIIPVYNRPVEIKELLESFLHFEGDYNYEIVIVEDGSTETSESIIESYNSQLNISYYFKPNSGPGDSRNYGMQKAKGNYYIILDSDVILPPNYLFEVKTYLDKNYVNCYGGPDAAHHSFSNLQIAINFAMTSFITTGGIRGGEKQVENFQPRSFNMGLSEKAFLASGGFGKIHPGEDPDLSLRLHQLGFKTELIRNAIVYHKRRISWSKFYKQVNKFGLVRPILNQWHPKSKSVVYWFPTLFIFGLFVSVPLFFLGIKFPIYIYFGYFVVAFVLALYDTKRLAVAISSILAILIQFCGYGLGFLKSTVLLEVFKRNPKETFPQLFFK